MGKIPEELYQALRVLAFWSGQTMAPVVRNLLREAGIEERVQRAERSAGERRYLVEICLGCLRRPLPERTTRRPCVSVQGGRKDEV